MVSPILAAVAAYFSLVQVAPRRAAGNVLIEHNPIGECKLCVQCNSDAQCYAEICIEQTAMYICCASGRDLKEGYISLTEGYIRLTLSCEAGSTTILSLVVVC